jgi:hypothetical protein
MPFFREVKTEYRSLFTKHMFIVFRHYAKDSNVPLVDCEIEEGFTLDQLQVVVPDNKVQCPYCNLLRSKQPNTREHFDKHFRNNPLLDPTLLPTPFRMCATAGCKNICFGKSDTAGTKCTYCTTEAINETHSQNQKKITPRKAREDSK